MDGSLPRRWFLRLLGAGAALGASGRLERLGLSAVALAGPDGSDKLFLRSWELVELPTLTTRPDKQGRKMALRITAENGALGVMPARLCQGFSAATVEILKTNNLLDHGRLYDVMVDRKVPADELKSADVLCWDLHARLLGKALHAILGTKRNKVLRYGDVRGQQPGFAPSGYAENVAGYLKQTGLNATKLHFPGNMGTSESISFEMVKQTLRAVRAATGPEPILAWDPYPASAESATRSLDEAKEILALMDELGYSWIEGPLPPVPFDEQIPKYVELMKTGTRQRIQAEGPRSSIGDGTPFDVMKQWADAGAISQCSTDVYLAGGLTPALRMIEYAKRHPPLVINLHWAWMPHAHLAMACEEKVMPLVEFPMGEDFPKSLLDGPHLLAPDWPGVYRLEE
ncbi:MAG: enolase C-terminal domain-like protein [Thermoguttaceae bacterium]